MSPVARRRVLRRTAQVPVRARRIHPSARSWRPRGAGTRGVPDTYGWPGRPEMSEYTTPSQAEGEREPDDAGAAQPTRTTPSQAEGPAEDSPEEDVPERGD